MGSVEDLENNVIHRQIDGIFRAPVAKSPAISYQQDRAGQQAAADAAVRDDLRNYRVEVVSVMIINIHLLETNCSNSVRVPNEDSVWQKI